MKLTAAQLKRLLELMSKDATKLSDADKAELTDLQAKAAASTDAGDGSMSENDVKSIVTQAIKDAGVTGGVTAEQVKSIVDAAVKALPAGGQIDEAKLQAAVKAAIPQTSAGLTADDVKGIVTDALKNHRPASKMQHEEGSSGIELVVSHRKGNLPVHAKQLLNVLTKGRRYNGEEIPEEVINEGIPESVLTQAKANGERAEKRLGLQLQTKAITNSDAGSGLELMNVTLSSTLLQRFYLESKLAVALAGTEVNMPTDPYPFPMSTTRPVFQLGTARTKADESSPGTSKLTLTSKKLIGRTEYDYEADEDSLIPVLPLITQSLGEAAAATYESAIINGDTTGAQDSDVNADAKNAARAFDGIRKLALAQASLKMSLATGGISAANAKALRKLLGRWGLDPKQLLWVVGPNGWNDIIGLPETLTAEKAGGANLATINTGIRTNLYGIDIVPSAGVREDLNASGVYDGTTTTNGSILLVHKPSWISGVRRSFMLETFRDVQAQTSFVVASFRRAFAPIEALSNTKAAAIGYSYVS